MKSLFSLSGRALNPFLRKIVTVTSGVMGARLIAMLAAPILTRIYSPGTFGQYGMYLAIISIALSFATLRYERGIVVTKSGSERHGLFVVLALLSFLITILLSTFLFILSEIRIEADTTLVFVLSNLGGLLAIGLGLSGIEISLRHLAIKERSFINISAVRIGQAIILSLSQILIGYMVLQNAMGLVIGYVIALTIVVLWLTIIAYRNRWLNFKTYTFKLSRILVAARRNVEFPKFMVWSAVSASIMAQSIVVLIGILFNASAVGQIFLAQRIVKVPVSMISRSISTVNFQEFSDIKNRNIIRIYRSRVRQLFCIGLIPFGIIALSAPYLFSFVFGSSWHEAGILTQLLTPGLFLQFVFTPFIPLFTVLREQGLYLLWSIIRLFLVLLSIFIGAKLMEVRGAVIGYSVSLGVSYLIVPIFLKHIFKQLFYDEKKDSDIIDNNSFTKK